MKTNLAFFACIVILTGCSASSGELVGGVLASMPTAVDNVQREQQTGPYQRRAPSDVSGAGIR